MFKKTFHICPVKEIKETSSCVDGGTVSRKSKKVDACDEYQSF